MLLHTVCLLAQNRIFFQGNDSDSLSKALYQKYLSQSGKEEEKMLELLQTAESDLREKNLQSALRKFQIGLLLEKKVAAGKTTFEFNLRLGEVIGEINRGYALEFFTKAANAVKADTSIHPARVFHMFTNKALAHQHLMEFDSALFYYRKAIEAAKGDNPVSVSSTYNNLGMFYAEREKYDSAQIYFQKALNVLGDKKNHLTLYTSITDNIAQLNVKNKRFDLAIPVFRFNDSVYLQRGQAWHYLVNKVRMLRALEEIEDPSINKSIQEVNEYIKIHKNQLTDNVLLDFYSFANDYYFTTGQHKQQGYFRDQMRLLSASLQKQNLDQLDQLGKMLLDMQEASLRSDINAYQLYAQQQRFQIRSIRFVAIAATVSLLLIILSLSVYLRKRRYQLLTERKLAENELQRKEMEARLLEQDLLLKKRDLTNVVLQNTKVFDTNQKIIDRLSGISSQKNAEQQIRSLLNELQTQNQISERSIGLQANIESVNEEFYEKLKAAFPGLTKSEIDLCGYIRINLSNKDISILKNVAASSVKMSKTRLRKKLGVSPDEDLYEFIRSI
jgi:tetratricopeptide (TPR) repeat protein